MSKDGTCSEASNSSLLDDNLIDNGDNFEGYDINWYFWSSFNKIDRIESEYDSSNASYGNDDNDSADDNVNEQLQDLENLENINSDGVTGEDLVRVLQEWFGDEWLQRLNDIRKCILFIIIIYLKFG